MNIGGFLATLIVVQVMGIVLERLGGYTFESFRVAWLAQYPIWVIALTGILISRGKARRVAGGCHPARFARCCSTVPAAAAESWQTRTEACSRRTNSDSDGGRHGSQ